MLVDACFCKQLVIESSTFKIYVCNKLLFELIIKFLWSQKGHTINQMLESLPSTDIDVTLTQLFKHTIQYSIVNQDCLVLDIGSYLLSHNVVA